MASVIETYRGHRKAVPEVTFHASPSWEADATGRCWRD